MVIPFAELVIHDNTWRYKGKAPGITGFSVDNKKHTFSLMMSKVADTGIPLLGADAPTSHRLKIQLLVPTSGATMTFESTIEILRKNSNSRTWNR